VAREPGGGQGAGVAKKPGVAKAGCAQGAGVAEKPGVAKKPDRRPAP
jgi:hypothetical protein